MFDLALLVVSLIAFEPLVTLAGRLPALLLALTFSLGVVVGGLSIGGLRRAGLPSLGGFEGLLLVLVPGGMLVLPMVLAAMAPKGMVGIWVWAMPLPMLFGTLLTYGATTQRSDAFWEAAAWPRAAAAFVWLIGCEALLVAFRRAHPDDAAFGATVAFLALFWLPARIAVKSEKGSRWELLSALVAFGWFCLELFLAAR